MQETRLREPLSLLLLRAREAAMANLRPALQELGLTEPQWRVLLALEQHGDGSAADLATRCVILPPSITRILRHLSDEGLVSVERNRQDGRQLQVQLTAAGRGKVQHIAPVLDAQHAAVAERLQPERLHELQSLLCEIINTGDQT